MVCNEHIKPEVTPGIKEQLLSPAAKQKLADTETGLFLSDAARSNYLGLDRMEMVYPAKEFCRRIAAADWARQLALQAEREREREASEAAAEAAALQAAQEAAEALRRKEQMELDG